MLIWFDGSLLSIFWNVEDLHIFLEAFLQTKSNNKSIFCYIYGILTITIGKRMRFGVKYLNVDKRKVRYISCCKYFTTEIKLS